MKLLNKITAAICGAAMLAGIGQAVAGEDDGVFTIAYAPNESTTQSADARNGLAKDLGAFLGCEVEEIQSTDYNAIVEAQFKKSYFEKNNDLCPDCQVKVLQQCSSSLVSAFGLANLSFYQTYIACLPVDKDINSIQDFKGKTIAFVDPGSTSGNLVPTAEIIKAFPADKLTSEELHSNGDFFEAVSFSGSHQAGLQAVAKGDVDIAPISDQILASEIEHGNASKDAVRIVHESAAIPAECMVVAEHVDAGTRAKLQQFLTSYDNEQYFTDVIKLPNSRFVPCSMADYEQIIELNQIINEL